MAFTLFVQTNGFGFALFSLMYSSMAETRSATLRNVPRRILLRVIYPNHRSTRLSHEEEVGVKWQWKRGCFSSQALTFGWLCVP